MKKIKVTINKTEIIVPSNTTVLQACLEHGIQIPHFCYHDQLSIAGNCRMCLVSVEKSPKPVASCALPVEEGMVIQTDDIKTKKARENVMELLLVNHPLDCPICDQGGECDLQDQAMTYGNDRGRFYETKRAVEDKNCGPLIKTVMTRCIHCTRCIRYTDEIAGMTILGTTGRGSATEVGTYIEKTINSEVSGNLIDLCPVGALTSKPYAFKARPWELKPIKSIDLFDAVHSNIRVDIRGNEIMRIVPSYNGSINSDWISDKIRFSYDGILKQRLTSPFLNFKKQKWSKIAKYTTLLLQYSNRLNFILEGFLDYKTAISYKNLIHSFGFEPYISCKSDFRNNFLLGTTINELVSTPDLYVFIGSNPRWESPTLNIRLRQHIIKNKIQTFHFGFPYDYNFISKHQNGMEKNIIKLIEGRHPILRYIQKAKNPVIILGDAPSQNNKILLGLYSIIEKVNPKLKIVNLLSSTQDVIKNEMLLHSFYTTTPSQIAFYINYHTLALKNTVMKPIKVYVGHHGQEVALTSKVIVPTTTFFEKRGYYMNIEGRVQFSEKCIENNTDAKHEDTWINSNLLFINKKKNWNFYEQEIKMLQNNVPNLIHIKKCYSGNYVNNNIILFKKIYNFYKTDNITRWSSTMHKCTKILLNSSQF